MKTPVIFLILVLFAQSCTPDCTEQTWFQDVDGDGFGNPIAALQSCDQPAGYILDNTDCDDTTATTYPGAIEICGNNIDDNCDGDVDENCIVVGAQYQGGTIIYVDASGQSGLIASNNDLTPSSRLTGAQNCLALVENGYSDWALPNKTQLGFMYNNRSVLNGLASGDYWSNTAYNPNLLLAPPGYYYVSFADGTESFELFTPGNSSVKNIRAIRVF